MRLRPLFPADVAARALIALALVTAGSFTGCGGSGGNGVGDKSPSEIITAAKVAADAARSVHVSGSIFRGPSQITLDMNLLAGAGGSGKLSEAGVPFELIQTGATVYIKGSPAFYRRLGGEAAAQLLQGKWLKAPTSSSQFASIASFTDLRQLLEKTLSSPGALAKGATATLDGQKVIGVKDTSSGGTLYVATTGPPYPIEISKGGSDGGTIAFDRWNEPVSLAPPADAIDISQLEAAH